MQLGMHYQTLSCFIPCNDNHVIIYGNCRCAHLVAALIGQTPFLIHVYLLISILFSVVLLVAFLFRYYKLILLNNIYQSQCQCLIQNQHRISMFIQPVSVNLHIFLCGIYISIISILSTHSLQYYSTVLTFSTKYINQRKLIAKNTRQYLCTS